MFTGRLCLRPYGIELAYDISPVSRGALALNRPLCVDVDRDGRLYITDYPQLSRSVSYYSPGRNATRIVTFHPETLRRADLKVPNIDGFQADVLRITPSGDLLLAQFGQWPEGKINGLLMSPGGEIKQEYRFGECVADVDVDDQGFVYVIYNEEGYFGAARSGQELIEIYDAKGRRIEESRMLQRLLSELGERVYDGSRINVMSDGGLLVNGSHRFDSQGRKLFSLKSSASLNITVVDEYDNILFIPPVRGGIFLLIPARSGFAEMGLDSSRPLDYEDYGWFHRIRKGFLYLLNSTIPKVEVYRLLYH